MADGSPSIRQVALLAAVARLGSIQRAAATCNLSQPGATQALALLQRRVGVRLLTRGTTGSALTPAGELFLARTAAPLEDAAEAIARLGVTDAGKALHNLTPVHLRLLTTLLETEALDRTAQALGSTENAARRTAHAIEAHLGKLLERTPAGVRLTALAQPCARALAMLACEIKLAVREVRRATDDDANRLVVGAAQAFGNRLLARVLIELADEYQDARVTVLRESPAELVTRLRAGEVDLVVGDVGEVGGDLAKIRLVATPYFVFARPGHPLNRSTDILVEDLARFDWVGGATGSAREQVRTTLFAEAPSPRVVFAASEGAVVGHFVAGSDRLALMTEHESRCGGLALGKLAFPPIDAGLGIDVVCRADRQPSQLHQKLVQLLREHLDAGQTGPARERHAA
nr:LysR family transcriptional regulator [Novosphingobium flavum]